MKDIIPIRGPEIIVFNLLNENLKKINVRTAIAHAIDKNEIVKFNDNFAISHDSIAWRFQTSYYDDSFALNYDLDLARALMISEGYSIPQSYNRGEIDYSSTTLIMDGYPEALPINSGHCGSTSSMAGKSRKPHLPTIAPFFKSTKPGFDRTMVLSMISSAA